MSAMLGRADGTFRRAEHGLTPGILMATTGFSYLHHEYTTAMVCAACFGFVVGLFVARWIYRIPQG